MVIAGYSQEFFILFLGLLWLWWLIKRTETTWRIPAAITLGQLISYPISEWLQVIFQRFRPYVTAGFTPLTGAEAYISTSPDFSLPSNHAVATAVFLYVFYRYGNRHSIYLIGLLTVLVGGSRVVVGVHYPIDIISGWILGGGTAVLACQIEIFVRNRFKHSGYLPFG